MNFDSYMEHCYVYDTKAYTISTLALQYINDTNRSVFYLVCSPNDVFFSLYLVLLMNMTCWMRGEIGLGERRGCL